LVLAAVQGAAFATIVPAIFDAVGGSPDGRPRTTSFGAGVGQMGEQEQGGQRGDESHDTY
jgi:hypothetical protein